MLKGHTSSECVHIRETPYLSAVPVIWDKCSEITNMPITEQWVVVLINRHMKHIPAPQWSEMHRTPQGLELRGFTETVVLALFHTSVSLAKSSNKAIYFFSTEFRNSFSGLIVRKIGIQARDCHAELGVLRFVRNLISIFFFPSVFRHCWMFSYVCQDKVMYIKKYMKKLN